MTEAIILDPKPVEDVVLAIDPTILTRRDELLAMSAKGGKIVDDRGLGVVSEILREMVTFERDLESRVKAVKAPYQGILNQISQLHYEAALGINSERDRLGALSASYRSEKEQKEKEEARERQQELLRLKKEQDEKERADKQAELDRQKEVDRLSEELKDNHEKSVDISSGKLSLEDMKGASKDDEEDRTLEGNPDQDMTGKLPPEPDPEEEKRLARMKELQAEELAEKAKAARSTPKGQHIRKKIEIDVHDVEALYKANPACVELKPRIAVIKALVKTLKDGESIPGVTHTETATTVVRS